MSCCGLTLIQISREKKKKKTNTHETMDGEGFRQFSWFILQHMSDELA